MVLIIIVFLCEGSAIFLQPASFENCERLPAIRNRTAQRIDWALWRSFLAVAETGSLSAAARRLSLTQPTIGRHVEQLEAMLGQRFFLRSPRGLLPTGEALALLPEARAMALAADSLERRASAPVAEESGIVRIAASHVVGAELLPEVLGPLLDEHPALEIELALGNDNADLLRHEADIGLRMARPTPGSLIARRLRDVPLGLFAHCAYLARRGTPQGVDDLRDHVLIGSDRNPAFLAAVQSFDGQLARRSFRLRCDSGAAQLSALRSGLGIAVCQVGIAAREESLVRVLPDRVGFKLDCWLAIHDDLRAVRRVRLVHDHLKNELPRLFRRTANE